MKTKINIGTQDTKQLNTESKTSNNNLYDNSVFTSRWKVER